MRLTNTLTGRLDELEPLEPQRVGIYVCGVTPYAESHVGHAMSAIVYDVLVRYLRWPGNAAGGYDVTYVSNYTDVDDKIIERAAEEGVSAADLANDQIARWEEQQDALGLLAPDVRPRVTTEIDTIIETIERIIEHDHAYATPAGDVYYRVRSKDDYGKLSHRNIDDLRAGTRGEPGEGKEFPLDFALWKSAKPGEPAWRSPWADGRPGWHIECSAMSQRYLGDTFDIHGGGVDLVFPHHENEVAQAEAATGKPFARVWLHNGLVQREGEKMSKSLGNVVTVADALDRWSPDALRLFVLTGHYRSPSNLTDEAIAAATSAVERLTTALRDAGDGTGEALDPGDERSRFVAAMEDDLNTPQALAAMFDLARAINRARDAGQSVAEAQSTLRELADTCGLRLEASGSVATSLDAVALSKLAAKLQVACSGTNAEETIEALLAHRQEARANRDFATADAVRDELAALSVEIEDTPEGPRWSVRS